MNGRIHFVTDYAFDRGNEVAAVLDMVARRAPLFMRTGGCGLTTGEQPNYGKPVPDEIRQRFVTLLREGKSLREISRETNWPYSTVVKHTRPLRKTA